jgi:hypothetical protein
MLTRIVTDKSHIRPTATCRIHADLLTIGKYILRYEISKIEHMLSSLQLHGLVGRISSPRLRQHISCDACCISVGASIVVRAVEVYKCLLLPNSIPFLRINLGPHS